ESGRYKERTSEALREAGGFDGVRNVFAGFLAAKPRRRKNFCRVGELERIESAPHALHGGEIRLGKHFGHHALFFFAHSVLTSDGSAGGEAKLEDFHRQRKGSILLAGDAAIVKDKRMEIAVACMKNIGDTQAVLLTEARNFVHHLRKGRARDYAVLDYIVRGYVANCGESSFAALP